MKPRKLSFRKSAQVAAALSLALFASCGKPAEPSEDQSPAAAEAAAATPQEDLSPQLHELTQALRKFSAEKQRVPASLNELVSAGYLTALPAAPEGRQFVINPSRVEVILADK